MKEIYTDLEDKKQERDHITINNKEYQLSEIDTKTFSFLSKSDQDYSDIAWKTPESKYLRQGFTEWEAYGLRIRDKYYAYIPIPKLNKNYLFSSRLK